MVYSLCSCIEIQMSIPLAAQTTVTIYICREMSIFALSKAFISSLTSYPAEIAYFSSPNQELFSDLWLMELY